MGEYNEVNEGMRSIGYILMVLKLHGLIIGNDFPDLTTGGVPSSPVTGHD
jgi:hypothetical protein